MEGFPPPQNSIHMAADVLRSAGGARTTRVPDVLCTQNGGALRKRLHNCFSMKWSFSAQRTQLKSDYKTIRLCVRLCDEMQMMEVCMHISVPLTVFCQSVCVCVCVCEPGRSLKVWSY